MSKTGIFYSFNSKKTAKAAEKIIEEFGADFKIVPVNAEELTEELFLSFTNLILGVPTWFDGELPNYWDEFVPALEDLDLKGKTIAIYGLGNQVEYPENFGDAVGIMVNLVKERGAKVIGSTDTKGYTYESSKAEVDGKFVGLILDQETQPRLSKERITNWVTDLKTQFK
ncbi:MAG: flavodoxin [Bacteroidota bacterium]|nr:flavodoxin [Bacteroidota bacterium]MDP2890338.1 flavodoxin [Bacteroidota bacterium]